MKRKFKNAVYEQLSRTSRALSHPKRIEILDLLSQGEKTVEAVAEELDLGIKNASAQLKELRQALLVDARRDGKFVYYRILNERVAACLKFFKEFGEAHFADIQKLTEEAFGGDDDTVVAVDRKSLMDKVKGGDVILLDVRPRDEYDYAHIAHAISIPVNELNKRINELPKKKHIVAYCRGPYCFFAKEAVEILRKKGFKAHRISEGVAEWEL
ncbi:MAG: ArsR/SmtB family transcription factor [Bdellovibrio sp.]